MNEYGDAPELFVVYKKYTASKFEVSEERFSVEVQVEVCCTCVYVVVIYFWESDRMLSSSLYPSKDVQCVCCINFRFECHLKYPRNFTQSTHSTPNSQTACETTVN